jgi:hypothetical protein
MDSETCIKGNCSVRPRQDAFFSKDEAHHRIKEQRFVRYPTGIVVAMSLNRWRA